MWVDISIIKVWLAPKYDLWCIDATIIYRVITKNPDDTDNGDKKLLVIQVYVVNL